MMVRVTPSSHAREPPWSAGLYVYLSKHSFLLPETDLFSLSAIPPPLLSRPVLPNLYAIPASISSATIQSFRRRGRGGEGRG